MNETKNMKEREENQPEREQEEQLSSEQQESPTKEQQPQEAPSDLESRLVAAEQQAASYKDLFLRKAAEFENFKKRTENENALLMRYANEELLLALLPVIDDLERSLKNAHEVKESPFFAGVELIHQKLLKVLHSFNVKPFETVGKEFDVRFHDALLQVPRKGVPPHTILEEVERGYLYHDKVLRHAKVIVSAETGDEQEVDAAGTDRERDSSER